MLTCRSAAAAHCRWHAGCLGADLAAGRIVGCEVLVCTAAAAAASATRRGRRATLLHFRVCHRRKALLASIKLRRAPADGGGGSTRAIQESGRYVRHANSYLPHLHLQSICPGVSPWQWILPRAILDISNASFSAPLARSTPHSQARTGSIHPVCLFAAASPLVAVMQWAVPEPKPMHFHMCGWRPGGSLDRFKIGCDHLEMQ